MTKKIYLPFPDAHVARMFEEKRKGSYSVVHDRRDADILVLTGGSDVNPKYYNESILKKTFCSDQRDIVDYNAFKFFEDMPKVGICRGGQFLNVMSGGSMWQHVENHTSPHEVMDIMFSRSKLRVSSTHHQMMIPTAEAEVLAFSEGLSPTYLSAKPRDKPRVEPEVVWYEKTKSLCFQPHPELTGYPDCTDYFFDLMDYFFI